MNEAAGMRMSENNRQFILSSGALLAFAALIGTGLLWLTSWHAQAYIADNERQALLRNLEQVLPAGGYDNDLSRDFIQVNAVGVNDHPSPHTVYRARLGDEPSAIAMTTVAPDGYSGDILILVGIRFDGQISGVRILSHRETPGLGDAIDVERSDWVLGFNHRSLDNPAASGWKVKKDGGQFDQFTGATITPRAVVRAVHHCLQFYQQYRARLFDAVSEQTLALKFGGGKTS